MAANLETDFRNFNRVMRKYLDTTSKSMAKALNSKAYELAWHAEKNTERASRAKIEALGVVGTKLRKDRKTGRLKRGRNLIDQDRAEAVLVGLWKKQGKSFTQAELKAEAGRFIGRRLSAIGYLASGWIPAIRRLFRLSDFKKPQPSSTKRRGTTGTGRAKPATQKDLVAIIENSIDGLENPNARAKAEAATSFAFRTVRADMEAYLLKKAKDSAREEGIEVR